MFLTVYSTTHELTHAAKIADVKIVLSEPDILPNFEKALANVSTSTSNTNKSRPALFLLDHAQQPSPCPEGKTSWRTLFSHGQESDWITFDSESLSRDTVCSLFFTSGTTGPFKCAQTTHRNFVSEHQIFYEPVPRPYPFRIVLCMPFFHVGIQPQVLVSVLRDGRETYCMKRFELVEYLTYHTRYAITESFLVPPMVSAIVMSGFADPLSKAYRPECSLRSVRNGHAGAAPLSGDMQRRFHALLAPGARHAQVWGMTETTSMASVARPAVADKITLGEMEGWGNVGVALPNMQMKLVDPKDTSVDCTEKGRGELCVKGPTIVKGYYRNEKATRESWDDEGYFHTGDVIQVDSKTGLWYVVERLKELIKVRGFQVAPAELEGVLTSHPDIVDAAVIGMPTADPDVENVRAYIVVRPGMNVTDEVVQAWMGEKLARYKQITGGVKFVEEIPKLPSGKILKRVLREEVKKELAGGSGQGRL